MNPTLEALMRAQSCIEDDDQPGVYVGPHRKREVLAMLAERIAALQAEQGQERTVLMPTNELECSWYFDCDGHYIDVERNSNGEYNIFFRDRTNGKEAWLDQSEQPTPPAEQWVSVKERLPEIGEEVNVFIPRSNLGKVKTLCRLIPYEEAKEFYWGDARQGRTGPVTLPEHVTHWHPLPPPPIDSTDAGDKHG